MNRTCTTLTALFAAAALVACGGSDDDKNKPAQASSKPAPAPAPAPAPTPAPAPAISSPGSDGSASAPTGGAPASPKSTYSSAQLSACPGTMKPAPMAGLSCLVGTYFGKLTDMNGQLKGDHNCKAQINADGKMMIAQVKDATNPQYYETEVYMPTTETAISFTSFQSTGTPQAPIYHYYFINHTPPHFQKPVPNEFNFHVAKTANGWSMLSTYKNEYAELGCLAEVSGVPN